MSCNSRSGLIVLCALSLAAVSAQPASQKKGAAPSQNPLTRPAAPAAPSLTADQVVQMVEAKVPEEIVAAKVKKNAVAFDLTPDQLIALKKAGASTSLIQVLMDPSQPYNASPAPPPQPAPVAAPPPPAPARAPEPATMDIGIYLKKNDAWAEVKPEIVNWKTGGTIKSLASAGVVKKDLNGNIDGPVSKTSVKSPLEVLIVAPEGVAVEEYQFLRLRVNKDYREFRSVTGGILNQRSGAMRDLIPFEGKKVASRQFVVIVPATLGAGEYGFLPPGAGGTSTTNAVSAQFGKMYTFRIVE